VQKKEGGKELLVPHSGDVRVSATSAIEETLRRKIHGGIGEVGLHCIVLE